MTIIISYLSHNYVVQVSDRRVVWVKDNLIVQRDDLRNKAVNLCHQFGFGYAGLAELAAGKPTDLWLTELLLNVHDFEPEYLAELVKSGATMAVKNLRSKIPASLIQTAIVGIGWKDEGSKCTPVTIEVSNFVVTDGVARTNPDSLFESQVELLGINENWRYRVTGRQLDHRIRIDLERNLRKCARKHVEPGVVIDLLSDAIRSVATRHPDVGADLMSMTFYRFAWRNPSPFYVAAPPTERAVTFAYLPADGSDEAVYGPNFVCRGVATTGFSVTSVQPDNSSLTVKDSEEATIYSAFDYYPTVVLGPWTGSGSFLDSHRPEVGDSYKIDGIGVIGNVPTWPPNSVSPYYGVLAGIDAANDIIAQIQNDNRYFVLWSGNEKFEEASTRWKQSLVAWFQAQGATNNQISRLNQTFAPDNRMHIADSLVALLKALTR